MRLRILHAQAARTGSQITQSGVFFKRLNILLFLFYPEITTTSSVVLDKTGGKKFSKEFEEASAKLEEFVNGLDKQVKNGPSLTEALENAGIFYEAQYKEVKVVANVSSNLSSYIDCLLYVSDCSVCVI